MSQAYANAGVDVTAGYESVSRITSHVARTNRPGVLAGLGGFGALFDLSQSHLKEPVLVSGTDGVGTKLLVAIELGQHTTVGIDLVAMCANDIVVQGAEPLYFLDYIATSKVIPVQIEAVVAGIATGCQAAGMALIGGETAELPGMYAPGHYDLAGFAVGAVEKAKLLPGADARLGDVLIGLPSSGLHSNGFSLVRKIISDSGASLATLLPKLGKTLGEAILEPTRIYVKPVLALLKAVPVHSMAHITGGGFDENIPRMLPAGLGAKLDPAAWTRPDIFDYLRDLGEVSAREMYQVFNMGIGFVIAVDPADAEAALTVLRAAGEEPVVIGEVVAESGVHLIGV